MPEKERIVNTYSDDASMVTKLYGEMRCTRLFLERILRVVDEGLFVDYLMEKYGKNYNTKSKEDDD